MSTTVLGRCLRQALMGCGLAGLVACGGGGQDTLADGSRAFAAGMAQTGSSDAALADGRKRALASIGEPVSADAVLDWAEYKFPDLFPRSAVQRFPAVEYQGTVYNARAYPGAWGTRYLGITPDGRVFGLGDFTGNALQAFETTAYWAGQVLAEACSARPSGCQGAPRILTALPAAASRPIGETATFSVMAEGAPPLSYQWQRNGVDLPGATAATYTTPVLGPLDGTASYRVRVANAQGSAVSSATALTVPTPAGAFGSLVVSGTGVPGGSTTFVPTGAVPRTGIVPLIWSAQNGLQQLNVTIWTQGDAQTGVSIVASPGTFGGTVTVNFNCNVGGTPQGCDFAGLGIRADAGARTLSFNQSPIRTVTGGTVTVNGTLRW